MDIMFGVDESLPSDANLSLAFTWLEFAIPVVMNFDSFGAAIG